MSSDPYQAYPSVPAGAPLRAVDPPAVQFIAAGPAGQRRLTVAFRLILVIPHLFAVFCLAIGAIAVGFIGWWAALFTGRLPAFAVSYLSGLARWNARLYGYMFLLTDVYPPLTVDDAPGYPVVIAIPEQGRLNRLAVFFRFILAIWAYIVGGLVSAGAGTIVALVAWLITLATGKMPTPLHLAYAAVLRYQTRYFCYLLLLTPTYPSKLFGDEPDPSAPVAAETAEATVTGGAAETATPAESAWDTPPDYGSQPASPSVDWPLVLPRSAKNLLILFIALGLITNGSDLLSAALRHHGGNSHALATSQWNTAYTALNTEMTAWTTSATACGNSLTCNTAAAAQAAAYMSAFASQVQGITMPTAATSAAAAKLVTDATRAAADFTTVSQDTTVAQLQADMASSGLSPDLDDVHADIVSLANALKSS